MITTHREKHTKTHIHTRIEHYSILSAMNPTKMCSPNDKQCTLNPTEENVDSRDAFVTDTEKI